MIYHKLASYRIEERDVETGNSTVEYVHMFHDGAGRVVISLIRSSRHGDVLSIG